MGRFLSILSIVALGVGFFSGLKVTKNAMIDTAIEAGIIRMSPGASSGYAGELYYVGDVD